MEEDYIEMANNAIGLIACYDDGLINDHEFCKEMNETLNYTSFCIEQQKRVDLGLPATVITELLIKAMKRFMKKDAIRYSGCDLDKGLYNDLDGVHDAFICWVNSYSNYYKNKSFVIEVEPQHEQPRLYSEQQENHSEQQETLPPELATDEALIYWQKAKDMGLIDDNYQFNGNKYQQTYFAKVMAEKIHLKYKWKPFGILWKCKYLAQTNREINERFGKVKKQKDIDNIFE